MTTPYDDIPLEVRRDNFGWFGPPWWSFVCYDEDGRLLEEMRKAAPVGEDCTLCAEPIEPGQSGKAVPFYSASTGPRIGHVHAECLLRSTVGPPEHLDGTCFCRTGQSTQSDLTYRQEALAVWERITGDADRRTSTSTNRKEQP